MATAVGCYGNASGIEYGKQRERLWVLVGTAMGTVVGTSMGAAMGTCMGSTRGTTTGIALGAAENGYGMRWKRLWEWLCDPMRRVVAAYWSSYAGLSFK